MAAYRHKIIPESKLDRIDNRLFRLRRHPNDGPMLSRFGYDHGNGLIVDSNGKTDLLFENTDQVRRDAAAILCEIDPSLLRELIEGYRLAKKAGLMKEPRP